MTKQQWSRILGTHGFRTPNGDVRVSNIEVTSNDGLIKAQTSSATATRSFDVDFGAAHAKCLAPERDTPKALSCSFTLGSENASPWSLDVGPGCTEGEVSEVATRTGTRRKRYSLRTDVLHAFGRVNPSREVALMNDEGVVAFTDSPGGDLFVFSRNETTLGAPEVLALVAMQTYASTLPPGQCTASR